MNRENVCRKERKDITFVFVGCLNSLMVSRLCVIRAMVCPHLKIPVLTWVEVMVSVAETPGRNVVRERIVRKNVVMTLAICMISGALILLPFQLSVD